jgi:hypothetical protein
VSSQPQLYVDQQKLTIGNDEVCQDSSKANFRIQNPKRSVGSCNLAPKTETALRESESDYVASGKLVQKRSSDKMAIGTPAVSVTSKNGLPAHMKRASLGDPAIGILSSQEDLLNKTIHIQNIKREQKQRSPFPSSEDKVQFFRINY